MGWENVKEHYRILHYMQVTDAGICIGSPYIHDIMVISGAGELTKRSRRDINDDIARYQREMDADPSKLRQLVLIPDTFAVSIPVYTYRGAEIVTKHCEKIGWPNTTHDGELMYENRFFLTRIEAAHAAKQDAVAAVKWRTDGVAEMEKRLAERRADLAAAIADLARLNEEFP